MMRFGVLLFHATQGQQVPVPQPFQQGFGGIPVPVTVPLPVPVPMPVPVTVPIPVPVPVPVPVMVSDDGGNAALPGWQGGYPEVDLPGWQGQEEVIDPDKAAACEAHPACDKHDGLCCPTEDGNMLACCSSVLEHWQSDHKYIITIADGATVRKEPSSTAEKVSTYAYGQPFDVINVKTDEQGNKWLQTTDGYIISECSATGEHVADHMIPPEPEVHIVTAPKGMVVREGLDKETAKIGVLKRGEKFHVLERAMSEKGELRLRVGPKQWVSETCAKTGERIGEPVVPKDGEQYVVTSEADVPLYAESALTTKVAKTLKKGDKVEVLERTVSNDEKKQEIFRTIDGWFAEESESGTAVVERTLKSKSAAEEPKEAKQEL